MGINDYKSELDKNGILAFVPGGTSMWPTLKHAKQSVIVLPKTKRLDRFDVGLYLKENGTYVLHRVIKVLDSGYVFVGDSLSFTEKVKEDQVIGVMTGFFRGKNYVDVTDEGYIKEVKELYSDEKKRVKKANAFHRKRRFLTRVKRVLTLDIFRRK